MCKIDFLNIVELCRIQLDEIAFIVHISFKINAAYPKQALHRMVPFLKKEGKEHIPCGEAV